MNTRNSVPHDADDSDTGLTQTLKALHTKTTGTLEPETTGLFQNGVVIVSSDKSAEKWATRWLGQYGFDVAVMPDAERALQAVRETPPALMIIDASARSASGSRLMRELQHSGEPGIPLFAICGSSQEVNEAIDANAYDIARKPVDWQILARRARMAVERIRRDAQFNETQKALKSALALASRARQQLRKAEAFEPTTGLPNRKRFIDLIAKAMYAADRDGTHVAVAAIKLSRCQMLIEALGRELADNVFSEVGNRLGACLRAAIDASPPIKGLRTAAIGNIGVGDFGIMLTCGPGLNELQLLSREIETSFREPASAGGQTVFLSATSGASSYPSDVGEAESLLIRAEAAQRISLRRGLAFSLFCPQQEAAAARRLEIEQKLYSALAQRELRVAYQPINDVRTSRVVAAEALLRWPQPNGEFIRPAEFIPIAEDAGLMTRLGEFVIEEVCRQIKAWETAGFGKIKVAVNASRSQLLDTEFPGIVTRHVHCHGVRPDTVEIEISERGILTDNEDVTRRLHELKSVGLSVSLDDFGTGNSSIAYLKDMPIDTLKIDRSYTARLAEDGRESRMVSAMIALAHQLDITVVAEGVETARQLNLLQSLSCDMYQGYLCSPAVSPGKFTAVVAKSRG
ncbi:MAG: EAL domain-containing protein [Gammaproteobacteria bacterium]|nr:EAL domain-containing protein [Gammaproteobacteria bacterium]MDH4253417.1 EAL domain-containing protein [Gammaproteobacteria bacterium]MDH5309220.1 EAL domain-containing protein [Gammaproteobacteria bacterium]